ETRTVTPGHQGSERPLSSHTQSDSVFETESFGAKCLTHRRSGSALRSCDAERGRDQGTWTRLRARTVNSALATSFERPATQSETACARCRTSVLRASDSYDSTCSALADICGDHRR